MAKKERGDTLEAFEQYIRDTCSRKILDSLDALYLFLEYSDLREMLGEIFVTSKEVNLIRSPHMIYENPFKDRFSDKYAEGDEDDQFILAMGAHAVDQIEKRFVLWQDSFANGLDDLIMMYEKRKHAATLLAFKYGDGSVDEELKFFERRLADLKAEKEFNLKDARTKPFIKFKYGVVYIKSIQTALEHSGLIYQDSGFRLHFLCQEEKPPKISGLKRIKWIGTQAELVDLFFCLMMKGAIQHTPTRVYPMIVEHFCKENGELYDRDLLGQKFRKAKQGFTKVYDPFSPEHKPYPTRLKRIRASLAPVLEPLKSRFNPKDSTGVRGA